MFRNYFAVAMRSIWQNRLTVVGNLIGLAVAIAVSVLVLLFVRNELSFDRMHANADRIYQLNHVENHPDRDPSGRVATPLGLGPSLKETFPEVERYTRVAYRNSIVNYGDKSLVELVYFVDPDYTEIFSFPIIAGDASLPLSDPSQVVVSARAARRIFGRTDVVGERVDVQVGWDYSAFTVGAVMADPPDNSSLQCDFLLNISSLLQGWPESLLDRWMWLYPETYIELGEGVDVADFQSSLPLLYEKHNFDERYGEGVLSYELMPLLDIHFHSKYFDSLIVTSNPLYSVALIVMALLVLTLASVNFTTQAIARSVQRQREVGLRKVLGAVPGQLRMQFIGESLVQSLLAVPIALLLTQLLLPGFNNIVAKDLSLSPDPWLFAGLVGVVVMTGVAAGFYPAVLLAGLRPNAIFKSDSRLTNGRSVLRSLVVFQFGLATTLLIGTLLLTRQIDYMINEQLEVDRTKLVSVFLPEIEEESVVPFVQRMKLILKDVPGVESVSWSSNDVGLKWASFGFEGEDGNRQRFFGNYVDAAYLETEGLEVIQGRSFREDNPTDMNSSIIVNEAFVRQYGLENPLDEQLPGPFPQNRIIGVVKDFHFHSLHAPIEPLVLFMNPDLLQQPGVDINNYRPTPNYIQIALITENLPETIGEVQRIWSSSTGDLPFEYIYVSEIVSSMYQIDRSVRDIVLYLAALAAVITLIGIWGLAAYTASQREKEIGIRRVLGASVSSILAMVNREFWRLAGIGILISWPLAYLGVRIWYGNFAYTATISGWVFALVSGAVLLVTLLLVSVQSWRTANSNPAETIRNRE